MKPSQLSKIWDTIEASRPEDAELFVHAVGIRSHDADVCVGRDHQARRHLLVPLAKSDASATSFRSSGLLVRTRALLRDGIQKHFLDLICLSPAFNEVFSLLIVALLQEMRSDEPDAAKISSRVLEDWKELFGAGTTRFGKQQITGMIGELIVLERLTAVSPTAVDFWNGPNGGVHDFRAGNRALEVKTSNRRYGRVFSISGHQQLEAPAGGELHLAAIKLEQNPGGAVSIPSLLQKIQKNGVNPSQLTRQLADYGYIPGDEEVEGARFDKTEFLIYAVTDKFPRIVSKTFVENQPPAGILKISYDIDLSGSAPMPMTDESVEALFHSFALGGVK